MATALHVKREKTALLSILKDLKRPELQALCRTHDIKGTNRAKNVLETSLADHCIAEHIGRIVNLGKCDCANLGASTSSRPLAPLRKGLERTASAPIAASSSSPSVVQLESQVDELLARLSSTQSTTLSEARVLELIESRLEEQRTSLVTEIGVLRDLCEAGFANVQASFDSVAEWRSEVTNAFENIQGWAKDVETRILANNSNSNPKPASAVPRHMKTLSSTPTSVQQQACQTPAAPPIPNINFRKRLSDASDYSLATIPEQPGTPGLQDLREEEEEEEDRMDELPHSPKRLRLDEPQVFENLAEQQPELPNFTIVPIKPDVQSDTRSPSLLLAQNRVRSTPSASKTLFGTETSAEERFADQLALEMSGSTTANEAIPTLPAWNAGPPCWVRKATV